MHVLKMYYVTFRLTLNVSDNLCLNSYGHVIIVKFPSCLPENAMFLSSNLVIWRYLRLISLQEIDIIDMCQIKTQNVSNFYLASTEIMCLS